MRIRSYKALIPIIVIAVLIVGLDFIARYTRDSFESEARAEEAAIVQESRSAALAAAAADSSVDWLSLFEEEGMEIFPVDADALFNDPGPYEGACVLTVIEIASVDTDAGMLKARTKSNHSIYFSIVCCFDNPVETEDYTEGDVVAVLGVVSDASFSVTMTGSHVIASGEEAQALLE